MVRAYIDEHVEEGHIDFVDDLANEVPAVLTLAMLGIPLKKPDGAVHYNTIGVIQGMRHLPATFTAGTPIGPGLDATLDKLQRVCDEQELARPITERKAVAQISD